MSPPRNWKRVIGRHETHQGNLILDATVAPQVIRYSTDLSPFNEAGELTELVIDKLRAQADLKKKSRIYRRKDLAIDKQRYP